MIPTIPPPITLLSLNPNYCVLRLDVCNPVKSPSNADIIKA